MVAEKGKKQKLSEEEHIDAELVLSIEKLQEVQDEIEKIDEEASDKVLEIEQKYNEIRRPVYLKRNQIIQKIPDFWLMAFLGHPALGDLLNDEDQKIFSYLESIDVEDFKDVKSGYSIAFNFKENPYFEDAKFIKTFTFSDDGTTNITGTSIKWKETEDTTNGVKDEQKGSKRALEDISFFNWFSESEQKDISDLHDEVAEVIKEDLWPNPLKYFNTGGDEEDEDEEENGDEDDGEDGGDDEEES